MKKCGTERIRTALVLLAIFLFFLVFFFKLHPIVIFDTDDWLYAQYQRNAVLMWGSWNPARILAETLMPLVTLAGAFWIDLFLKDHFVSVSLAYALTVTFSITVLCGMLYRLWKKESARFCLLAYFLLCHFWVYRRAQAGNYYMLHSPNATCYFYYVIPNLLNCILVLWLMRLQLAHGGIKKGFCASSFAQKGVFVLLVYFAIFSNIWASIILAVYVGACSLFEGIRDIREKRFSLVGFLKDHLWETAILILWAIEQIYEINGGRAQDIGGGSFFSNLLTALSACVRVVFSLNRYFLLSTALILVLGPALAILHKEKDTLLRLALLLTCLLVNGLYLVLSCSRTGAGYLSRPDVQYGCFFFGMLILLLCAGTILRRLPPARSLVPLLLVMVLCNCNTGSRTYADSVMGRYSPAACMRLNNDIMQQFLDAQELGQKQITLVVPQFGASTQDNWPIALYGGPRFASYFYEMGITETQIEVVEVVPSPEKNTELRLWAGTT